MPAAAEQLEAAAQRERHRRDVLAGSGRPERLLVNEQVSEAQIPAANGYLSILLGHANLLGAGEPSYTTAGSRRAVKIAGGWVEVSADHARVLANTAEKPGE